MLVLSVSECVFVCVSCKLEGKESCLGRKEEVEEKKEDGGSFLQKMKRGMIWSMGD